MPPSTLSQSTAADTGERESSLHIRRRLGSVILSVRASWVSDSNATMSGLPGPGLPLGQLLSAAGRRLEVVIDRTAARAGWGFEGIARRLLMKLRAHHSRCRAWPEFATTPVVDLAMELGSRRCAGCNQRYMRVLHGTNDGEVGELLLRLVPSIESDIPANRTTGSMLLAALALSDDNLLAALRQPDVLKRVELSLHSCKINTVQDNAWLPVWRTVRDLREVIVSLEPIDPFMAEPYSDEQVLQIWRELESRASILRGRFRLSILKSDFIVSRLESTIEADQDLLQQLCKTPNLTHLDALYLHMLSNCSGAGREYAMKLLGTVVVLGAPSTPSLLATLLQLPLREVIPLLQTFAHTRLILTESPLVPIAATTAIRICHESFCGFVVEPHRCRVSKYLVSPALHHETLLDRCLSLLNKNLCQDICDIRNPGLANADVPELPARIARAVPEAVRYACMCWPVHLVASSSVSGTVSAALLDFCTYHIFHWLEVLSLLGELSSAGKYLPRIMTWCQGHLADKPSMEDILVLLRDVYQAVRAYANPITSHALQVYQSVLATGPTCKLLNYMRSVRIITPRLLSQRTSDWRSVLHVIKGHTGHVNAVAYSPDGTRLVSGSDDRTVRVWDDLTGTQLTVLEGHGGWVWPVAFSPDGAHIVSGSTDKTVRVWDAQTGMQLAVLKGHKDLVRSVSFSPDGTHIVSGSTDKTVRVWDAMTGLHLSMIEGHTDEVNSVACSPDGTRIVSGSDDNTARVWDVQTGMQLVVLEGHSHWVLSVTFSPDGARVVSGSADKTVRLWDAPTGRQIAVLEGHSGSVFSVVFSPNKAHIASGSSDDTIRVWDASTSEPLAILKGHSGSVFSVAFSPDGSHIVSGSGDRTIRVWDSQAAKQLPVLEGHSNRVFSVGFSPDGTQIATGSRDKTVRVWDSQTGEKIAILQGHSSRVQSVAFSLDGQRITSRDRHGAELTWNVPDARKSTSAEEPIADLRTEILDWNEESGWISWRRSQAHSVSLCWLPHERRGESFSSYGATAVIGARKGAVTILDFSEVIAMLNSVDQTSFD